MREQLLAARNPVMGTTNILLITVPDGWRIADGYAAPEIDEWSEHRQRRWMTRGRAPYRLLEPHPEQPQLVRAEVELLITATPLKPGAESAARVRLHEVAGTERAEWAGHEAEITVGTVRRGFLPARAVPALHVHLACPETGRRLALELNAGLRGGNATARLEDLAALAAALRAGVSCH